MNTTNTSFSGYLYFTVAEEQSLFKKLKEEGNSELPCKCQACVLDCLRKVVYDHAILSKNCKYEDLWHHKKEADSRWVIGFEIRHTKGISKLPLFCEEYTFQLSSFVPVFELFQQHCNI